MNDESIYHEYANWKLEVNDLVTYLRKSDSSLIVRFKHVFDVTDYLYDKLIDDPKFSEEENQIFETGFYYVYDQIDQIQKLLNETYDNQLESLEKYAKDINLFLTTINFQNELLSTENYKQRDLDKLIAFEKEIEEKLFNKESISKEMFDRLDHMTYQIFYDMDVDYYPINDIFFEIADELGIL